MSAEKDAGKASREGGKKGIIGGRLKKKGLQRRWGCETGKTSIITGEIHRGLKKKGGQNDTPGRRHTSPSKKLRRTRTRPSKTRTKKGSIQEEKM